MASEIPPCAGSRLSSVIRSRRSWLRARSQSRSQLLQESPRARYWVRFCSSSDAYINDLPQNIISQVRLIVDDTAIYLTIENKNGSEILQRDLDRLQAWESKWDKEFNPSKCQVIRVATARIPLYTQYILHGQVLEVISSARYLGWISPVTLSGTHIWTG